MKLDKCTELSVLTLLCFWRRISPAVIEQGNFPSSSTRSLGAVTRDIAIVLLDFDLPNGTLREYLLTSTGEGTPTRLQIWRPLRDTHFRLISETRVIPYAVENYSIPGNDIPIRYGDKMGFLSESYRTGIAYDFLPLTKGSLVTTHDFSRESFPVVGQEMEFNDVFDVYAFALSVLVDTDPDDPEANIDTTRPTLPTLIAVTDLALSRTFPPTTTSTSTPTPRQGLSSTRPTTNTDDHGNAIVDGDVYVNRNSSSTTFIMQDTSLPGGVLEKFKFYFSGQKQGIFLQVWRPRAGGRFTLVHQQAHVSSATGVQEVAASPQIYTEKGDMIGFTTRQAESGIVYTEAREVAGPLIAVVAHEEGHTPVVGRTYSPTGLIPQYRFSLAVEVTPDADIYQSSVASSVSPMKNPIPKPTLPQNVSMEDNAVSYWLWFLIPIALALIAISSTLYALYRTSGKTEKKNERSGEHTFYEINSPDMYYVGAYENHAVEIIDGEWDFPREQLTFHQSYYQTYHGTFYRAEARDLTGQGDTTTIGVKQLKETASDTEKQTMLQEIEVLKSLCPHPNILQFLGCCIEADPLLMLLEYTPLGSLQNYLREIREANPCYTPGATSVDNTSLDLVSFALQITRGMSAISSLQILHRDLSTRNVMLGVRNQCKLMHFGYRHDFSDLRQLNTNKSRNKYPLRWLAPEVYLHQIFTTGSDVWSFGILLWELFTLGCTPYGDLSTADVPKVIRKGQIPDPLPHCVIDIYALMSKCWRRKPEERPSFEELETHLDKIQQEHTSVIQLEAVPDYFQILDSQNVHGEIV